MTTCVYILSLAASLWLGNQSHSGLVLAVLLSWGWCFTFSIFQSPKFPATSGQITVYTTQHVNKSAPDRLRKWFEWCNYKCVSTHGWLFTAILGAVSGCPLVVQSARTRFRTKCKPGRNAPFSFSSISLHDNSIRCLLCVSLCRPLAAAPPWLYSSGRRRRDLKQLKLSQLPKATDSHCIPDFCESVDETRLVRRWSFFHKAVPPTLPLNHLYPLLPHME